MMDQPFIAYVGPVAFPEGGAGARRILGNAKAIVEAGWRVTIISGQPPGDEGLRFDVAPGIDCVRINERDAEHLPKALRYSRYAFMGSRSKAWLEAQTRKPDAIILYSGYSPYLLQLTGWARRHGIPIIFDVVEWYTAPSALGLLTSPYLWNIELAMRFLIPRCDGVLVISRGLERYYSERGLGTCRVPPLVDAREVEVGISARGDGPLRLAYAGSPGGPGRASGYKDLIDEVVHAVVTVDGGQDRIHIDIVGISEEDLRKRPALRDIGASLPACLTVHGRLPQAEAAKIVSNANFTVFSRHINRVSTMGFATKFVESLIHGTPVITNLTGDLGDHLRDGENGFVCTGPDAAALARTLERADDLDGSALADMRRHARCEAERSFDYRAHTGKIGAFLTRLTKRGNVTAT